MLCHLSDVLNVYQKNIFGETQISPVFFKAESTLICEKNIELQTDRQRQMSKA